MIAVPERKAHAHFRSALPAVGLRVAGLARTVVHRAAAQQQIGRRDASFHRDARIGHVRQPRGLDQLRILLLGRLPRGRAIGQLRQIGDGSLQLPTRKRRIAHRRGERRPGSFPVGARSACAERRAGRLGFDFQQVRPIGHADVVELPGRLHRLVERGFERLGDTHAFDGDEGSGIGGAHTGPYSLACHVDGGLGRASLLQQRVATHVQLAAERNHLLHEDAVLSAVRRRAGPDVLTLIADDGIGQRACLLGRLLDGLALGLRDGQCRMRGERPLLEIAERVVWRLRCA